ncbi:MAG: hypothetical protein NTX36_10985 [Proteobacteria bacterium]|nr:hypothetical protein [Pseudomonadota bacterium]
MFKNNDLVRFENPAQELLKVSLSRAGIPVEKCAILVHHYGRFVQDKQ